MAKFKRDRIYYFRYRPKFKEKLPFYDRQPLMFPLGVTPTHTIGINFHWVAVRLRPKFLNFLIKQSAKMKNSKAFTRFTYEVIKNSPELRLVAEKGIRLYINKNASNVKEVTRADVMELTKKKFFSKYTARKVFRQ